MIATRRLLAVGLLALSATLAPFASSAARAQDEEAPLETPGETAVVHQDPLLKDLDVRVWGPWRQTAPGNYEFDGAVTITWRGSRIQADRMTLVDSRYVEATGNVLILWQGNRISGTHMTYDLSTGRGVIEDAIGTVQNDYLFWAARAEKVGERTVHLERATVTTCTQPVPYWSFSVSSATITIDEYAWMWNVRLRARRMPIVYMPLLVWPVKEDRAMGLLMPEFQSTQNRGEAVSQELFIPLGRSADVTVLGKYFTEAGFGGGGELRFVPNQRGSARLQGFYINDQVAGRGRYSATYQQTQQFLNGFRMVADVNLVSDFDYFSDFERELNLVSSPTILARLEFSRNAGWTSMNVRELRREQLFSDGTSLVQQTLPEIEWRGRSRRLGRSPFYLSFESSLASIQQRGVQQGQPIDADYMRGDLFPTLTLPFSPAPWLDLTPRVAYRVTHYTQSQLLTSVAGQTTQRDVLDASLTRSLFGGGLDLVGPKFYRIFERESGETTKRFKHAIEPRLSYGYQEANDETDRILLYDEVDRFSGAGAQASYGITQRLFAQRPRAESAAPLGTGQTIVMPDGRVSVVPEEATPAAGSTTELSTSDAASPPPLEPLEIASFEVRQSRSFDRDVSLADLDGDGINESASRAGPLELIGRYNPSRSTSLDVRGTYDILYDAMRDVSLSGTFSRQLAQMRFTLVHRNGLGVMQIGTQPDGSGGTLPLFGPREDDTQLRLTTQFTFFRGKVKLLFDGLYDADPLPGQEHIPDKRWRVQYRTQCCEILVERLARNYSTASDRRDFYFRVDLTGIGKLLDFKY